MILGGFCERTVGVVGDGDCDRALLFRLFDDGDDVGGITALRAADDEVGGKINLAVVHRDYRRRDVACRVAAHDFDEVLKVEKCVVGSAATGEADVLHAVLLGIGDDCRNGFRVHGVKARNRALGFGNFLPHQCVFIVHRKTPPVGFISFTYSAFSGGSLRPRGTNRYSAR